MRIALGVSNLSTRQDSVRRSGIQEVAFQALKALARWDSLATEVELIPIFRIPDGNPGAAYDYRLTHVNPGPKVFEKTFDELGIGLSSATERWPHLAPLLAPDKNDVVERDASTLEAILSADIYFETSLTDTRNATRWLKRLKPSLKVGHLVHDVGPVLFPEYVAEGMNSWFSHQYLECLRSCDFLVSVSRHTALDVDHVLQGKLKQFYVSNPTTPLASDKCVDAKILKEVLGLPTAARFVLSVATLEPRKNLEHTISGFLKFRELYSSEFSNVHCVLIGASGWKNEKLIEIISNSKNQILQPGFVSSDTLVAAFKHAEAVLLPSHYEGFGIPISEARSYDVPVITCINSSLPEAAVLDATFVSPFDQDELALALARVLRQKLEPKSRGAFEANETWDDTLRGWVHAMKTVDDAKNNASSSSMASAPIALKKCRESLVVQLDCHNITISHSRLHKTGIQEVSARLFAAVSAANNELNGEIKFEPLPVCIPHYKLRGTVPTLTPTFHHWRQLCEDLNIDLDSLGSNFMQILSGDSVALAGTLQQSDWLILASQLTSKLIPGLGNARAAGMKLGYLVHDIIPSVLPQFAPPHLLSWFNEAYVSSLKEADLLVGNSRHTAIDLFHHLGDAPHQEIHWARFPIQQNLSSSGSSAGSLVSELAGRPYFVMVGSTDPRKNVVNALNAMERFSAEPNPPDWPILVMIGASGWNNEKLNAQVNALEKRHLIKRMGYLADSDLDSLIKHCKGLLMTSRYEGFGMPIAQANSHGIPVITCNNSSLPEVAMSGNSLFVAPENPDELYLAMRRVLNGAVSQKTKEKDSSWVELLVRIGHILAQYNSSSISR